LLFWFSLCGDILFICSFSYFRSGEFTTAFSVATPTIWNSLPAHQCIPLLTSNNSGGTWRRICSLDIQSVSASEVLCNRALQIDIYLLTYILTGSMACVHRSDSKNKMMLNSKKSTSMPLLERS